MQFSSNSSKQMQHVSNTVWRVLSSWDVYDSFGRTCNDSLFGRTCNGSLLGSPCSVEGFSFEGAENVS